MGKEKQKKGAREFERENRELYADFLEEDIAYLKLR